MRPAAPLRTLITAVLVTGLLAFAAGAQPRHPISDERAVAPPAQPPPPIEKLPPKLHVDTLAAPTGLAATTDEPTCSQHGGGFGAGLACKAAFPAGQLVLVWSWTGHATLTGYRIYRVDGGQRTPVGSQTQGDGKAPYTIFIFQTVPAGGYGGECFAATAYTADVESPQSGQFCVGGRSVVQVATLAPSQMRSLTLSSTMTSQTADGGSMGVSGDTTNVISQNSQATTLPHVGYDPNLNSVARTGIAFDLTPYMYKTIKSARLNMSVQISAQNTAPDGSDVTDHYTSCIAQIGVGMDQWWTFTDWFDVTVPLSNVQEMGPEVSFDVTPIVQKWASGSGANNGFVLLGAADAPGVNFNNFPSGPGCLTIYRGDDIQLVVEYN